MRRLLAGLVLIAAPLAAQRPAAAGQPSQCILDVENVDRQGVREVRGEEINYYAGGNVRISCRGMNIHMFSDSVAAFAGRTVRFIGHVRYVDSTLRMTADTGTYYKDGERWEARGHVVTTNLRNGSTLQGPSLDYFRPVREVRDTFEMYAVARPRISYAVTDSTGAPAEPYRIVADRVRMRGEHQVWAGGRVTIDRSDFSARGDSLRMFTGPEGDGTLLGRSPELHGLGSDTFDLRGSRIDFTLADRELTGVTALGKAEATTASRKLTSDTIQLGLDHQKLDRTVAWGRADRPHATATDYEVRSDSLVLESPGQQLRELRAFGQAWLATRVDSTTGDRDWLSGDSVRAVFLPRDSLPDSVRAVADTGKRGGTVLQTMTATGSARALHSSRDEKGGKPAVNYVRADRIVITMRPGSDSEIERVAVSGHVDGIQLEPGSGASSRPPAPAAEGPP